MFLCAGTGAVGQIGAVGARGDEGGRRRERFTIRDDTEYETDGYVLRSSRSGPTAVVFGGVHGNEVAGYRAANAVTTWDVERGTPVAVPELNAVAIEEGTRSNPNGDLNRRFPTGSKPETPLARELWEVVTGYDADLVVDMHTSGGIWDADDAPSGVGQAVFPTPDARETASEAIATANDRFTDDRSDDYEFSRGNTLEGDSPLLVHKVASDLGLPGYLTEVTWYELDYETQTTWHEGLTEEILRASGLEVSHSG